MKKTNQYIKKSSFLFLLIIYIFTFSGCHRIQNTFDDANVSSENMLEYVDILSVDWAEPGKETVIQNAWDIVQYLPGVATPANSELCMWRNHVVFGENQLFSLLYLSGENEGEAFPGYEMKKVDLNNMKIKSCFQSLSDLDFDTDWDEAYVSQLEKKVEITSVDTDGENTYMFFLLMDDAGNDEHFYNVRVDSNGKAEILADYIDFFNEKIRKTGAVYYPEIICGKDGNVYYIDREGKAVHYLNREGETIISVDASDFIRTFTCIGKTDNGIPLFIKNPSVEKSEIFYLDENGKNVLYSGAVYPGIYSFDKYGNVLIVSGSKLLKWDVQNGSLSLLYEFVGMDTYHCMGLERNEKGEIVVCFENGEEAFLYRLNNTDHPKRIELVLLLDYNETYIESCAADYSRIHPEVSIKVEYLNSDDDFSWQKVLNNIKKGEGPDLIYTTREQLGILQKAGVICSLDGIISDDVKENLFNSALKIGEFDSKLYAVPCGAYLMTLMVNDAYWDKSSWTMTEVIERYNEIKKENNKLRFINLGYGIDSLKLFLIISSFDIEYSEFVDIETKTCNFETEEFYNLLRFCRDNCDKDIYSEMLMSDDERRSEMIKGNTFLMKVDADLMGFSKIRKEYGDNFHVVGYPTENRSIGFIRSYRATAVNSMSENKDIAADFISTLVSEEYQTKYSLEWVRKDVITEHVKDSYHKDELDIGNEEKKPAFIPNSGGYILMEGREDGSSFADEYISIMDRCEPEPMEYEIQDIVYEESSAFFAGQKTEEEVAKIIQSRVQIYLDERK